VKQRGAAVTMTYLRTPIFQGGGGNNDTDAVLIRLLKMFPKIDADSTPPKPKMYSKNWGKNHFYADADQPKITRKKKMKTKIRRTS
jgi:hypothetical protein